MIHELYKVEAALSAIVRGISQPWCETMVLAHGLSGQRNRLGNALDHLLANPNGINARLVTLLLAKELVTQNVCTDSESWDLANDSIGWWWDQKCPYCAGRGVTDFEQTECEVCSGKGLKQKPKGEKLNRAIGVIEAAQEWMEGQLRKRLGY